MNKRLLHATLLLILSVTIWSCRKDDPVVIFKSANQYDAAVPEAYFDLSLKITKETAGYTPPVAARAFGYTGLALYESVVHGMPGYRSMGGLVNGLQPSQLSLPDVDQSYDWALVANNCLASFIKKMYSSASSDNLNRVESLRQQYNNQFISLVSSDVYERSVAYGNTIADQVFAYAKTDGQEFAYQNNFPTNYVVPVGPGFWVPTPPAYQSALQPYWGAVRPFLTANITATQPAFPTTYSTSSTSSFYSAALEVYTVVSNLTPEQEKIAKFWSDDPGLTATPPGHSISITGQVLKKEGSSLAKAAEAYAKVGMAVHDAFISCWKCKYDMSLMRPITYIRDNIDNNWNTILTTPPFPEYTSGHSVQGAATSRVLSEIFGYNYSFTDKTHQNRTDIDGSPRHYTSFYEMADEAAVSRLYGGIHYREAIERGVTQGRKVGTNICALPFQN